MTGWGSAAGDSAGLPWAGRELGPSASSDDDGRADPALRSALEVLRTAEVGAAEPPDGTDESLPAALEVVAALLLQARLLVPVVATVVDGPVPPVPPHRPAGDHGAQMSLPLLGRADGGTALPAFTGLDGLAAWHAAARPVPVPAVQVAAAALQEGCDEVALDPAGPAGVRLPRPVLVALAHELPWRPPWRSPEVLAAVGEVLGAVRERHDAVRDLRVRASADPTGALIEVVLTDGLDARSLRAVLDTVGRVLVADDVLAARLGSVRLAAVGRS